MKVETVRVGATEVTVQVQGAANKLAVLLLPGSGEPAAIYDEVCARLLNSGVATYVPTFDDGTDVAELNIPGLLDALGLTWVHLVGNNEGADAAWLAAAGPFGRFSSLVVVGRGHPAVADATGAILDPGCAAVEVSTTLVLANETNRAQAYASGRHVYSDYRVVELEGLESVPREASAALAAEIAMRTTVW